jgi:hypothetical protein
MYVEENLADEDWAKVSENQASTCRDFKNCCKTMKYRKT